ncbi:MAG: Crp/Fnr family transcriptional regulator [Pseudomonadota bacterium]
MGTVRDSSGGGVLPADQKLCRPGSRAQTAAGGNEAGNGKHRNPSVLEERHHEGERLAYKRDILTVLSDSERNLLLQRSREVRFASGAALFTQGDRHVDNFLIRRGLVRTYYISPAGREITLAYWSDHDMVGGPNFFDADCAHQWSSRAMEPTEALAISGHDLRFLTRNVSAIADYVIEVLVFKLRWISWTAQTLATESVHSRLAHLLLHLSELYGRERDGEIVLEHIFSQEELGNMVGATRPWISMLLRDFQKNGLLRMEKRRLVICNPAMLQNITLASAKDDPDG